MFKVYARIRLKGSENHKSRIFVESKKFNDSDGVEDYIDWVDNISKDWGDGFSQGRVFAVTDEHNRNIPVNFFR